MPQGLDETCDTVGVLSPITDIIGSFQAIEAIKLLVGAKSNPNLEQLDVWYQFQFANGRFKWSK